MAESNTNLIILRLEGVMQSWGENSKWNHRASSQMPSKSGIVGMLACAMGLERDDHTIVELGNAITIAVRADRPGLMATDYQTVTGYPLLTAEGKPRSGGNTFISRRDYLQDASFTVFLEAEEDWKNRITDALRDPVWPIYLGRKNCVPSRPVLMEITKEYGSLHDAVNCYPTSDRSVIPMEYELEERDDSLSSYNRTDQRVSADRIFTSRRVWRGVTRGDDDVSGKD
ncbi:MAG: type I-E CRISPR-associated protein Cas5/CasD [Lachnospiraceae bacterium]|nr:type I-E CRISPR-associated protein Cas5/CasD [Lachnospiraceae bacterium]